jgi:hypothetical protein
MLVITIRDNALHHLYLVSCLDDVEDFLKMPSPSLFISLKRDNEILVFRIPSLRLHSIIGIS